MAAFSQIIIHLVHGTWPCGWRKRARWEELRKGTLSPDRYWFVEGSSFCEDIKRSFNRETERSASCSIKFVTFTWSGTNTFTARHKAATELREHLKGSLCKSPNAYHVVVAHSHGGTVAFEAIANDKWEPSLPAC